jgi:hypothetical protein
MMAVRNLLSSLNNLAQSGLLASGWLRLPKGAAPTPVDAEENPYIEGGVEPPLEEVLDDPVIHLMMRADRLEPEQVRRLLTRQGHTEP